MHASRLQLWNTGMHVRQSAPERKIGETEILKREWTMGFPPPTGPHQMFFGRGCCLDAKRCPKSPRPTRAAARISHAWSNGRLKQSVNFAGGSGLSKNTKKEGSKSVLSFGLFYIPMDTRHARQSHRTVSLQEVVSFCILFGWSLFRHLRVSARKMVPSSLPQNMLRQT